MKLCSEYHLWSVSFAQIKFLRFGHVLRMVIAIYFHCRVVFCCKNRPQFVFLFYCSWKVGLFLGLAPTGNDALHILFWKLALMCRSEIHA